MTDIAEALEAAEDDNRHLRAVLEKCLSFIDNAERELGMTLECGDLVRAALAHPAGESK